MPTECDRLNNPHSVTLKFFFFSFFFSAIPFSLMANGDSLRNNLTQKDPANFIEVELLAENYMSPLNYNRIDDYGVSPVSIFYSRNLYNKNIPLDLRFGLGFWRATYTEKVGNSYVNHDKVVPDFTLGVLWKANRKRNGFLLGLSCNWAFGKQTYFTRYQQLEERRMLNYDYQLMPDVCYQFRSKGKKFTVRLFYTPKISSGVFKDNDGYEWVALPIWGGVSIGGGW